MASTKEIIFQNSFSDDAHQLLQGVKLPPQPKVILELSKELQRPDTSFSKIQDLLSKDAALSAKVLKLVNSPLFRNEKKVESLERALTRLGLLSFYTLVLSTCLKEIFDNSENKNHTLWEHTQIVAGLAKYIAELTNLVSSEHAYMAGLFHDSAFPILMAKDDHFEKVMKVDIEQGGDIEKLELESCSCQTSHTVIGHILAKSWGLPNDVCEAILLHHTPDLTLFSNTNSRILGMIIMLSDHLARQHKQKNILEQDTEEPAVITTIRQTLNLQDHQIDELLNHIDELIQTSLL